MYSSSEILFLGYSIPVEVVLLNKMQLEKLLKLWVQKKINILFGMSKFLKTILTKVYRRIDWAICQTKKKEGEICMGGDPTKSNWPTKINPC